MRAHASLSQDGFYRKDIWVEHPLTEFLLGLQGAFLRVSSQRSPDFVNEKYVVWTGPRLLALTVLLFSHVGVSIHRKWTLGGPSTSCLNTFRSTVHLPAWCRKSSSRDLLLLLPIFWVAWPSLLASNQTCGCSSHSCVCPRTYISLRGIWAQQVPLLSSCSPCGESLMTTPGNFEQLQLLLVL